MDRRGFFGTLLAGMAVKALPHLDRAAVLNEVPTLRPLPAAVLPTMAVSGVTATSVTVTIPNAEPYTVYLTDGGYVLNGAEVPYTYTTPAVP